MFLYLGFHQDSLIRGVDRLASDQTLTTAFHMTLLCPSPSPPTDGPQAVLHAGQGAVPRPVPPDADAPLHPPAARQGLAAALLLTEHRLTRDTGRAAQGEGWGGKGGWHRQHKKGLLRSALLFTEHDIHSRCRRICPGWGRKGGGWKEGHERGRGQLGWGDQIGDG